MKIGGLQKLTLIDFPGRISCTVFLMGLKRRKELLEGVVVCGGEPTLNKDLPKFVRKIKKLRYLVKLDTNGSNPEMLKRLIADGLINYVAMDVKLPKERYPKIFRKKLEIGDIEKSIEILKQGKVDYEFRTTMVPTVLDKEDILKIAQWLSPAPKYFLQNFRPEKTIDPGFEKIKPYSEDYLSECCQAVSPFFETCQIR